MFFSLFVSEQDGYYIAPILIASVLTNVALLLYFLSAYILPCKRTNKTKQANPSKKLVEQHRASTFIQQHPNGWYRVANSDYVKKGECKLVNYFGLELVVFRGNDGHVGVLDAHCPHLGANLGVEGRVVGNNIQCPFHHWEFDSEGTCQKIPYCDKAPQAANTGAWVCVEKYGMIMIWYHATSREKPDYDPISIPELDNAENFSHYGSYEYENIGMNIQDFAENSVDYQHFQPLHGNMSLPWSGPRSIFGKSIPIPFVKIIHDAKFELSEKEAHVAYFKNTACLEVFGKKLTSTSVNAQITFYGPAGITLFRFEGEFGVIYLFHTHTPTSITSLDVGFVAFSEKKISSLLTWYIIGNWVSQWQNDILVWENKLYMKKPVLVKGDGPVMKLRRWYRQFYTQDLSF